MEPTKKELLVRTALEAMQNAYVPYSHFQVGAALLCKDGSIFSGVNVENASYGLTICAERTAVVKAVSEGHREFSGLVVATNTSAPSSPCGACRQFLSEFGDFPVWLVNPQGEEIETSVSQLLPLAFGF
ncbi:MAG TPA: cytidine deaminase [Thermotogota bacterium]|nr:cytidine deaminase [Thermotogota bacterium]HRW91620.1 cytidine deaminase [Thermotogota bacterium]